MHISSSEGVNPADKAVVSSSSQVLPRCGNPGGLAPSLHPSLPPSLPPSFPHSSRVQNDLLYIFQRQSIMLRYPPAHLTMRPTRGRPIILTTHHIPNQYPRYIYTSTRQEQKIKLNTKLCCSTAASSRGPNQMTNRQRKSCETKQQQLISAGKPHPRGHFTIMTGNNIPACYSYQSPNVYYTQPLYDESGTCLPRFVMNPLYRPCTHFLRR